MAKGKFEEWLTDEGLLLIEGWARDGLIDEQIAKNMGVRRETLANWKNRFQGIRNALKKGKEVADREVENALFKRAVGYRYTEVTEELRLNRETGKKELTVTKRLTKEVLPDVTAQIFWLKNRKRNEWRDRWDEPAEDKGAGALEDWIAAVSEGEMPDGG